MRVHAYSVIHGNNCYSYRLVDCKRMAVGRYKSIDSVVAKRCVAIQSAWFRANKRIDVGEHSDLNDDTFTFNKLSAPLPAMRLFYLSLKHVNGLSQRNRVVNASWKFLATCCGKCHFTVTDAKRPAWACVMRARLWLNLADDRPVAAIWAGGWSTARRCSAR
jgi:hypothetical protein